MKRLLPFLKPYKKELWIGPSFKLAEAILEIFIPTLMAYLIDYGVNQNDTTYIWKMGGLMFVIGTLGVIFAYVCQYTASIASQGFGTDVRNALFKHINKLSQSQVDSFGTSSLINRMTGDINQLQSAVAMLIRLVIRAPFLCIGGLVMAILIDVKLSIILMIVLPLFIVVLSLVMRKAIPLYKKVQSRLDEVALVLRENLSGVRVIRAFARVDHEKERFKQVNSTYADTAIYVGRIVALMNPATTIIMNLAIIAVIWFGGVRVNTGNMTQGQVIAYINYITQILNSMIIVANLVILYTKAYASAGRVSEVLAIEPVLVENDLKIESSVDTPKIEFENVSMAYHVTGEKSLENINFSVKTGETIGIIGGTGSGKSTLISLISRFYDVTEGIVRIDGQDIKEYGTQQLRQIIGLVPQKAVLFRGTIAQNLRLGKEDATDESLRQAIEIAQATDFVEKLPNKYDTFITQGGTNLSGGQKQRLTIARAIVKNPDILILDDSSSALDYITDANLRKALKDENQNRTVLLVSQRVNTVKGADRIIVLHDGKMVGLDTHENLIKDCEIYREICYSQEQIEEVAQ